MVHKGTVTGIPATSGGLWVQLDDVAGYQVGPLEGTEVAAPYAVGDRVVVGELLGLEYVVLGRLP